jgi:hypothetical protein
MSKKYAKLRIKQTGEYPIMNHTEIFLGDENLTHSIKGITIHLGTDEVTTATLELIIDVDIDGYVVLEKHIKEEF